MELEEIREKLGNRELTIREAVVLVLGGACGECGQSPKLCSLAVQKRQGVGPMAPWEAFKGMNSKDAYDRVYDKVWQVLVGPDAVLKAGYRVICMNCNHAHMVEQNQARWAKGRDRKTQTIDKQPNLIYIRQGWPRKMSLDDMQAGDKFEDVQPWVKRYLADPEQYQIYIQENNYKTNNSERSEPVWTYAGWTDPDAVPFAPNWVAWRDMFGLPDWIKTGDGMNEFQYGPRGWDTAARYRIEAKRKAQGKVPRVKPDPSAPPRDYTIGRHGHKYWETCEKCEEEKARTLR